MKTKGGQPQLWIKIDLGPRGQIGPGKIALLQAIQAEDSIAGAARSLAMSYRRAWLLVDELNRTLGGPVVETHVGGRARGGAEVTPLGQALIQRYQALQDAAKAGGAEALKDFGALLLPE